MWQRRLAASQARKYLRRLPLPFVKACNGGCPCCSRISGSRLSSLTKRVVSVPHCCCLPCASHYGLAGNPGVPCVEAHYTDDSVRIRLAESHPWRPRVWFPHRLDKHARGLMAVAFSSYSCGQLAASLSAGMWRKRYRVLAAIPPRELRRVYRNPLISSGDGSPLFQHGTGDMVNTGTIVSYLGERDADRYACEGYWLRGSTAARHGRGDF